METIVFLDRATIGPSVHIKQPEFEHNWIEFDSTAEADILDRLQGATIVIINKVPLRRNLLEKLPDIKMIAVAATGYDMVDLQCCSSMGIAVCNVREYANKSVPEHTFALIFALRRSLIGYRQDVIDGEWEKSGQFCFFNHSIQDLSGSTLGIIGKGALGKAVATIAEGLGMQVQFAERKGEDKARLGYVAFERFLATSDIITLHCPLSAQTHNLLGRDEFQKMTRCPLLINVGRGGLVNESDTVEALNDKKISGLGFDCLTSEPIATDHPFKAIMKRSNVIISPHVAWASEEAMQTLWNQVVSNIENYQTGFEVQRNENVR